MDSSELKLLTTTSSYFEAQVIIALLHSQGIVGHFNGSISNPYPITSKVEIFVSLSDFPTATGILLINQVEEVFDPRSKIKLSSYSSLIKISSILLLILLLLSVLNIA